jgi:hypothetical protein
MLNSYCSLLFVSVLTLGKGAQQYVMVKATSLNVWTPHTCYWEPQYVHSTPIRFLTSLELIVATTDYTWCLLPLKKKMKASESDVIDEWDTVRYCYCVCGFGTDRNCFPSGGRWKEKVYVIGLHNWFAWVCLKATDYCNNSVELS